MLAAELTHHLASEAEGADNHRYGSSSKTVLAPGGAFDLSIPRDRLATFEPQLVAKYQRRLPKFDDHVIGMYARGMTVREIQVTTLWGLCLTAAAGDEILRPGRVCCRNSPVFHHNPAWRESRAARQAQRLQL